MSYLIRVGDVPQKVFIEGDTNAIYQGRVLIGNSRSPVINSDLISVTQYVFKGRYKDMVCDISDRVYYIIKGYITNFRIGDECIPKVREGDLVFIPKGKPYGWDYGDMTYFVMNGPAFKEGSDTYTEPRDFQTKYWGSRKEI